MRKKLNTKLTIGLAILGLFIAVAVFLCRPPSPFDYTLKSASLAERTALTTRLVQELSDLRRLDANDPTHSAANDADRLMPLDRTLCVLAIQDYVVKHDKFPKSLNELQKDGLDTAALRFPYVVNATSSVWTLSGPGGIIAKGN